MSNLRALLWTLNRGHSSHKTEVTVATKQRSQLPPNRGHSCHQTDLTVEPKQRSQLPQNRDHSCHQIEVTAATKQRLKLNLNRGHSCHQTEVTVDTKQVTVATKQRSQLNLNRGHSCHKTVVTVATKQRSQLPPNSGHCWFLSYRPGHAQNLRAACSNNYTSFFLVSKCLSKNCWKLNGNYFFRPTCVCYYVKSIIIMYITIVVVILMSKCSGHRWKVANMRAWEAAFTTNIRAKLEKKLHVSPALYDTLVITIISPKCPQNMCMVSFVPEQHLATGTDGVRQYALLT